MPPFVVSDFPSVVGRLPILFRLSASQDLQCNESRARSSRSGDSRQDPDLFLRGNIRERGRGRANADHGRNGHHLHGMAGGPSRRAGRYPLAERRVHCGSSVILGLVELPSSVAPHDHVLRNQTVGSRCSVAVSTLRLAAVIRIKMSFGPFFAYSTVISK
jgi:hypothetical protein